jgi:hypothetical protein
LRFCHFKEERLYGRACNHSMPWNADKVSTQKFTNIQIFRCLVLLFPSWSMFGGQHSTLETHDNQFLCMGCLLGTIVSGKGQELWYRNLRYKLVFVYFFCFPVRT